MGYSRQMSCGLAKRPGTQSPSAHNKPTRVVSEQEWNERVSSESIILWRGLLVWILGTTFVFMITLLLLFLYLLSRNPITVEDMQQCRESEFEPDSDVVQLTQDNYFNLTSQKDASWLIELYNPKCAHCRRMKNAWEETATELKQEGDIFRVGRVDCKCEAPICRPFALTHFPGIYLIENGNIITYDSTTRTKSNFINWAHQVSDRYRKTIKYET